jgi:glycosyltransferase involved in cell wall biosynthesis
MASMYSEKKIAVVVPCYNEEKFIAKVIETMPDFVDYIVVIDDKSVDRTVEIVNNYKSSQPDKIILLQHKINQGVGGAIATGYIWCRDNEIDIAVVMAGDAQMDPIDLPALIKPIADGRYDYSKGNRLFTGDAWNSIPKIRYLGNSALSLLTKIASGYWRVADSQCGYTAISLNALKVIDWNKMYKRYGQPNDLLVRLNINTFRVCDVPVTPIYYRGAESGIKPLRMIPWFSWFIFRLFMMRMLQRYVIRDFHPLVFFYAFAAAFLGIFTPLLTLRLLVVWYLVGNIPSINSLAIIVIVVTGLQFFLFAMWFDMQYNTNLS